MNTMKIQTEILKELYKKSYGMSYQSSEEDIFFSEGYYAVRIPKKECFLNLEHERIMHTNNLKRHFENHPNSYIAQSTNVLKKLGFKVLIRKMESGNGTVCCWISERHYKLFGDKYQYLITAPDKAIQVLDNHDEVVGVIMPVQVGNSTTHADDGSKMDLEDDKNGM